MRMSFATHLPSILKGLFFKKEKKKRISRPNMTLNKADVEAQKKAGII